MVCKVVRRCVVVRVVVCDGFLSYYLVLVRVLVVHRVLVQERLLSDYEVGAGQSVAVGGVVVGDPVVVVPVGPGVGIRWGAPGPMVLLWVVLGFVRCGLRVDECVVVDDSEVAEAG